MKNIIFFLLICSSTFAQTFVQTQLDMRIPTGGTPYLTATIFVAKNFKESKWGISAFTLTIPNRWAEAYAGPTFAPNSTWRFGCSVGGEMYSSKPRIAPSIVRFGKRSFTALFTEHGLNDAKNYWYSLQYLARTDKTLQLGFRAQRFYGVGPQVAVQIGNSKLILHPAYETEKKIFQPTVFWQYNW